MRAHGHRVHSLFGGTGVPADCVRCGWAPDGEDAGGRRCEGCGRSKPSRAEHNKQVLRMLDRGDIEGAFATSVGDKGLDCPGACRAVIPLPSAGGRDTQLSVRFKQQIGRLSRPKAGKRDAKAYYVWDREMGAARQRAEQMEKEGVRVSILDDR
jgi:hypothetical protein